MATKIIHAISGPRNISTALMYSFSSRPSCLAIDEPFYALYLKNNPADHPIRDTILSKMPQTYNGVIKGLEACIAKAPKEIYIKNMSHHMVDQDFSWFQNAAHIFWIRHPRKVINSFAKIVDQVTLKDVGYKDQFQIWKTLKSTYKPCVIVDTDDLLNHPEDLLKSICNTLEIEWHPEMLSWPKGPKPFDGIWAPYWYANAHRTSRFTKKIDTPMQLSKTQLDLIEECLPFYNALFEERLKPSKNATTI